MKKGNFRRKKFGKKRKNTYKIFFLVIVGMTVGFAAINTTLQLIGTLNIARTTWNIHWENPTKTGGVNATTDVHLKQNDNTTVEYQVNLANQGDYYEFTVDAKNDGTIDAMITGIENKVYENNVVVAKPDYLDFTVTYSDGKTIANNHLLAAGKSETYKVKVMYKTGLTADQLPTSTRNLKFTFTVTYMQADENTCQRITTFENDSWDTIECNVKKNPQSYQVGATKTIEMDLDGDNTNETYTLRVANNTTPAECSTTGFSQSSCGFVIEFADVITTHRMNPYSYAVTDIENGDGTKGGWEYSDMRAYLNSTTYAYGNIDYSTNGIYNALPSDLKSKIINTTIVSGYGSTDRVNFTTTDKLYLFSPHEIWEDADNDPTDGIDKWDKSYTNTRQLDYYHDKGVTTSNYSEAIKKNNGSPGWWWLRSANYRGYCTFYAVDVDGSSHGNDSNRACAVSPAFRIG